MQIRRLQMEHEAALGVLLLLDDALCDPPSLVWLAEEIGRALDLLGRELPAHMAREEQGVFAEAAGDAAAAALVAPLRDEHAALRRMLCEGQALLDRSDIVAAAARARELGDLLRRHIAAEEGRLFPLLHPPGGGAAQSASGGGSRGLPIA